MKRIERWRRNCNMSRAEMSRQMDIPIRTIENWEGGVSAPPEYVERLVVNELRRMAEARIEEAARKQANKLKSDEEGKRPVGSWVVISSNGDDEFVSYEKDMTSAIKSAEQGDQVAYVLCNDTEDGPVAFYEDKNGNIFGNYDNVEFVKEED